MDSLDLAINMEMEAKRFYLDVARKTTDDLGKSLFNRLAMEEDFHAAKAREIWDFLSRGENPLAIEESLDRGKEISQIFSGVSHRNSVKGEVEAGEWEVIRMAMDMEEKSRIFYEDQSRSVANAFIKRYFTALSQEERGHYLALVDFKEFLIDPASWYAKAERHSFDGG